MSDRLEEFVKQHREQFDPRQPDPSVWLRIQPSSATVSRERSSLRWLRIAAAVAMIFAGSSAGIYFLAGGNEETPRYSDQLLMEMQEAEQYYTRMVAERYNELRPYLASDPAAKEMLTADMEELDQVYLELRRDLEDNVSNPEVIEAMILNYRVKLEILEEVLHQLKEKENQDYENQESLSL
jgi:hypothetical protein